MTAPPVLYHYTCLHSTAGITADRYVRPRRHPLLGVRVVWLTDLDTPDKAGLGLTAHWISCDRTVTRVDVHPGPSTVRWGQWAHEHQVPRYARDLLETDAMPAHWWVSETPVPVIAVHSRPRTRTNPKGQP